MRVLGLDFGEKRIGAAVSDATGLIARGIGNIEHTSRKKDIAAIKGLVKQYKVEKIVIGLPLSMDGTRREKAREVLEFVAEVKRKISLPIKTFDERLTTRYSERLLISADMSRKKRKKIIDTLSAEVILQNYLDAQKETNEIHTDKT